MVRLVIGLAFLAYSTLSCDAKISGRVMDGSHGAPLAGVTVTFGQDGPSVTTNASGDYHFDGVWIGKIKFAKDGFGTVSRSVDLDQASENVVLTLSGKVTYVCTTADEKGRWQIARTVFDPVQRIGCGPLSSVRTRSPSAMCSMRRSPWGVRIIVPQAKQMMDWASLVASPVGIA